MPLSKTKSLLTNYGAEFDDKGNFVGLGLTLNATPHTFTVNGEKLYAWCATDTLMFPRMLNATAALETVDPVSGDKIRLVIGPNGVKHVEPRGAVLSLSTNVDARDVRGSFCAFGDWFTSPKTASEYASKCPGHSDTQSRTSARTVPHHTRSLPTSVTQDPSTNADAIKSHLANSLFLADNLSGRRPIVSITTLQTSALNCCA